MKLVRIVEIERNLFVYQLLINIKKGLSNGIAQSTNKLDEIKKELRCFTSLHGFSSVLKTSNPFVKVLWMCFFLVLFSGCIQNVFENISDYYQYTVITKIEYVNEYPMALPAVTLCLASYMSYSFSTKASFDDSLLNCTISGSLCDIKDFYSFEARASYNNELLVCSVLNGGRNSTGHLKKIKRTKTTGPDSGFVLQFYLPKDHFFFYFINDAHVKPTMSEINRYFPRGTTNDFIMDKTIETKLESPFNNCWDLANLPDTPLVRQLNAANITYRQVNCFELCFQDHVRKYSLENGISEDEARLKYQVENYDRETNCNLLCPLECESTQYKMSQSMLYLTEYSAYSLPWIPFVEKKLNITINSTEEFNKNFLDIFLYYDSLKYTKISQTPKTSLSGLVSNLGGSTGLFLDLSFMSACRAIEFILGVIFKF